MSDIPEQSAEICVCEIFGTDVSPGVARVGVGVHPHQDPAVIDDFERVEIPIYVATFHNYAAEWSPCGVRFSIDGQRVKTVAHAITYPMQLMLCLYEFPLDPGAERATDHDPKRVSVASVRGYRYQG